MEEITKKQLELSELVKFKLDFQQAVAHNIKDFTSRIDCLNFEGNGKAKIDLFRTAEKIKLYSKDEKVYAEVKLKDSFLESFSEEDIDNLKQVDQVIFLKTMLGGVGLKNFLADSDEYKQPNFPFKEDNSFEIKLSRIAVMKDIIEKNLGIKAYMAKSEKTLIVGCYCSEFVLNEKQLNLFSNMFDVADRVEIKPYNNGKTKCLEMNIILNI